MTNISDVQFSQIKPNDYFKKDRDGRITETQEATQSLIKKLLRISIVNPYTREDYNKVVENNNVHVKKSVHNHFYTPSSLTLTPFNSLVINHAKT